MKPMKMVREYFLKCRMLKSNLKYILTCKKFSKRLLITISYNKRLKIHSQMYEYDSGNFI